MAGSPVLEALEARLLLNGALPIVIVDPSANTHSAPADTNLSAAFSEAIDPATATDQSFVVHAIQTGQPDGTWINGDPLPPRVLDILVSGAGWQSSLLSFLAAEGLGDQGYSIPVGSEDQLAGLPWVNIDQIKIAFDVQVLVEQEHLSIHGVDVSEHAFLEDGGFHYEASTLTATWMLASPIQADKLLLVLDEAVTNTAGDALDGEWADGISTVSGDGAAGGVFRFRLNVLPGDVDGSGEVRSSDTIKVRRKTNTAPGDADYSPFYDVDGSGENRSSDTIKVRRKTNTSLPPGEPDADAPGVTIGLDPASDTDPVGDGVTEEDVVTLVGTTEADTAVVLVETGASTVSDAAGSFQFAGVALSMGDNTFTAQATDAAGNVGEDVLTVTRVASGLFGDPDVASAVRTRLGIAPGVPLEPDDLLGLTSLSLDSNAVDSLVGLEQAANLTSLEMLPADYSRAGRLSSLAPISGLAALEILVLHRAGLDDGDLATLGGSTSLRHVDLRYNELTGLAFTASLPSLERLFVYGNGIGDDSALAGRLVQVDLAPTDLAEASSVAEVAEALHHLPAKLYEYVLNNFRVEPYAGFMKGADATLETGAGNAWDQSALLAALMHEAGVDTRFVTAQIEVDPQTTMDWLGVKNVAAAGDLLANALLGPVTISNGEEIVAIRFDHTWLEAELEVPGEAATWLPLDPSWKFRDFREGVANLIALAPFNEAGYLAQTRHELAYEFYQDQIAEYLATHMPGVSPADVAYDGPIIPHLIEDLDGNLPFIVTGTEARYDTMPVTDTHRVQLTLQSGGWTHFDQMLVLPQMSLSPITITYGAAGGGQLQPQLRLAGEVLAESEYSVPDGAAVTLTIRHYNADGDSVADRAPDTYDRQAGQYIAVGLDAGQVSGRLMNRLRHDINDAAIAAANGEAVDPNGRFGAYASLGILGHFYETRKAEKLISGLTEGIALYKRVASGLATCEDTVQYFEQLQFPYRPDALGVDIANSVFHGISIDGDAGTDADRRRIVMHNKSAAEHAIWEQVSQTPSMSTIKSLQLANERGVPIHVIDSNWSEGVIRSTLQLSTALESNIVSLALHQGHTVTVPQQETPLQDWEGVGYIAERDLGTEWHAVYAISGGLNGESDQTIEGGYITGLPFLWPLFPFFFLNPFSFFVGDPISIANGNVSHEEIDLHIPNIGQDLAFERVYNSTVAADVGLGAGWTHSYSDFLAQNADETVTWTDSRGVSSTFTPDGTGEYVPPTSLPGASLSESGGGFIYRDKHGRERTFDLNGRLTELRDRNDNALALTYDASGLLASVADTQTPTRAITFGYTGDRITSVNDFTGRTWTYTYDPADRVGSVTTPSDAVTPAYRTQYDYHTDTAREGLLHTVTHADGGVTSYSYYANRRGFEVTDPEGYTHDVAYNIYRQQSTFTDERGFETVHQYDDNGNLIEITHLDGTTESWTWSDFLRTSHTDVFGMEETFAYDAAGNLTGEVDRLGYATAYAYDPTYNLPTIVTRPNGAVTTSAYDGKGNLIELIDALGHVTSMTYDNRGQLLNQTDPLGRVASNTYNQAGQVVTHTDPLGGVGTYTYDEAGNLLSSTDANGQTWTFSYGLLNRRLAATDPLGNLTALTYTPLSGPASTTDALGRTTTYEYDLTSRLRNVTDPMGGVRTTATDGAGNVVQIQDALGRVLLFVYDERGRQTVAVHPDGAVETTHYDGAGRTVAAADAAGSITTHEYDALGRVTRTIDAMGFATGVAYDSVGNLISITDALGNVTSFEYDAANRLVSTTDALSNVASHTHDPVNNLLSATDPAGRATAYTYDELNRRITQTDPLGNVTTTEYDAVGNVVSITDPNGNAVSYSYDALNRLIQAADTLGGVTAYTYDAVGNLLSLTDPASNTTTYTYDGLDRRITDTNALGNTRTDQYDPVGNRILAADRNGRARRFAFDRRDRLVDETWLDETAGAAHTITLAYDAVGRPIQVADAHATYNYTYDAAGRALSTAIDYAGVALSGGGALEYQGRLEPGDATVTGSGGEGYMDEYTFDADVGETYIIDFESADFDTYLILIAPSGTQYHDDDGGQGTDSRIERTIDEAGTWTVWATSWPLLGSGDYMLTIDDGSLAGLTFEYTYDGNSNLLTRADSLGGLVTHTYDALNRRIRTTDSGTDVAEKRVDFAYNAVGQFETITRCADLAGTQEVADSRYVYDGAGRLIGLTHAHDATTIAEYTWTWDAAGRITQMTSPDGVSEYGYDGTDQLTAADHDFQPDEAYAYDANGNRTNTGYVTGPNNQLLADGAFEYEYDAEGNLVRRTETATGKVREFGWDHRNRLVRVVDRDASGEATQTVEYTYDANDDRIAKSVDADGNGPAAAEVEHIVNDNRHVAMVFDADGNRAERHLHGPDVDQVLVGEDADGMILLALTDHQGTVRDMVSSAGAVFGHIQYDSFGQVTAEIGPVSGLRFAYTGREFDAETGLYYYRARYYDPAVGRFVSEDPLRLQAGDANLRRYVGNAVTTHVDAFGLLRDASVFAQAHSLQDALASIKSVLKGTSFLSGLLNAPDAPKVIGVSARLVHFINGIVLTLDVYDVITADTAEDRLSAIDDLFRDTVVIGSATAVGLCLAGGPPAWVIAGVTLGVGYGAGQAYDWYQQELSEGWEAANRLRLVPQMDPWSGEVYVPRGFPLDPTNKLRDLENAMLGWLKDVGNAWNQMWDW